MNRRQGNTLVYENEDMAEVSWFVSKGYRTIPKLYVNGKAISKDQAALARPGQTLLSYLRDVLRLTGTKLGCGEGGCGACTVMISRFDGQKLQHYSANACLMPVLAADNTHVTTIEHLGSVRESNLHPIQQAMVDMHGSQCGFCTPGIIVALYSLFANNPTREYIEEHLDGNLCRCTGYRPIWDAARSLCIDAKADIIQPCGLTCHECPQRDECKVHMDDAMVTSTTQDKLKNYARSDGNWQWLEKPKNDFPTSLLESWEDEPLIIVDGTFHNSGTWLKATTLIDLLVVLKRFQGNCKIVVGNTEVGIETKFKQCVYPRLIQPSHSISELFQFSLTDTAILIGACLPLSIVQSRCADLKSGQSPLNRTATAIYDMLRWFASTQIRNVACLGGNLVTGSPISDMNPLLVCMGAKISIASIGDDNVAIMRRFVSVSDFFLSYRKVDLLTYEIIEHIEIPLVQPVFEYIIPFKQARRREDDISIVTAGMRIKIEPDHNVGFRISDSSMAFGGMAPKTILAVKTAQLLKGEVLSEKLFTTAGEQLHSELSIPENAPGGQTQYRETLAVSFLYRFFHMVVKEIESDIEILRNQRHESGLYSQLPDPPCIQNVDYVGNSFVQLKKPTTVGSQTHPSPICVHEKNETRSSPRIPDEVGKSATHLSAPLHCTGEAIYVDDIPTPPDILFSSLILAKTCDVTFVGVNIEHALQTPGVVSIYFHEDLIQLHGDNKLGPILHDEYVFLPKNEKVAFIGQVIGICVANSLEAAEIGARCVEVILSPIETEAIVSIADAIAAGRVYECSKMTLERSNNNFVENGELIWVEGSFRSGGQEHFYLETNATLVVPTESSTHLTVYSSTQNPTETQKHCSLATNTPASNVVVRVKRMGGGFGGKETRSVFVSCAVAVAAKLSGRPVKLSLSRDIDMSITGGRHSFLSRYRASAMKKPDGRIKLHEVDIELFSNGGSAFDLSGPVMARALFHADGPYYWSKFKAVGLVCKTVQPPHTAFRGFGGPQGMAVCEHIIDHLSFASGVSGEKIRQDNFYKDGECTPFGMKIGNPFSGPWNIPNMWDKLIKDLNLPERRRDIEQYNNDHRWIKRGAALLPTKFGIAFTAKFMNQGGALVHLYTDGTVLVTHGGTEMGQGLHTKICQIAAQAFGIGTDKVTVTETATDKVANTIATAASMSTDLYGMATLDACKQILGRLEPIYRKLGYEAPLSAVATAAFYDRIDLSAHGFFALDGARCGYDWQMEKPTNLPEDTIQNSWRGQPFNYFTQGIAYCEVEIDVLTGNHRVLRTDLLVDVGASINPSLDIGQIEGAFIQGMGWSTLEEVIYADQDHTWIRPRGRTFTTGPGTYKIPAFNDVPEVFNVRLMDRVDNPFAIHSSKAVGEPPFFLGCSVFYAIKDAVRAQRKQCGATDYFEFRMPATSERIRMACRDPIVVNCIGQDAAHDFQTKGSF